MNVLIYGDPQTSPTLRHEVPVAIGDPFLYLEADGRRVVLTNTLEEQRLARDAPKLERVIVDSLGRDELIAEGRPRSEVQLELCVRATALLGIREAVVPPEFPLALGDRLRAAGIALTADEGMFDERRRHKTEAELAGIRRAVDAAKSGLEAAATMLREAVIEDGTLMSGGGPLTAEAVRARIREVCARLKAPAPADILVQATGPDPPVGHDPGSGPLPAHVPIVIDLWPQDERSGCWADMTRTFVRGEVSDAIAKLYELVLDAHERACAAIRPEVPAREPYEIACDVFEAAGHPTQRTKKAGEPLSEGFYYSLGHGVGLAVHEAPVLGRADFSRLTVGDVLAVEPGTVVRGIGGARVEDLLLVTPAGSERLTGAVPYQLTP